MHFLVSCAGTSGSLCALIGDDLMEYKELWGHVSIRVLFCFVSSQHVKLRQHVMLYNALPVLS